MNNTDLLTLEKNVRIKLSDDSPIVVRLDGKNVTKDHRTYHLLDMFFTQTMFESAKQIAEGHECRIYAAIDEVSIVFAKPYEFFEITEDNDLLYSAIIILQKFLFLIREHFPETMFNISVFNLQKIKIEDYIACREQFAQSTALFYCAKEFLPKSLYKDKTNLEILDALNTNSDFNAQAYETFYKGLGCCIKSAPAYDLFDLFMEFWDEGVNLGEPLQ